MVSILNVIYILHCNFWTVNRLSLLSSLRFTITLKINTSERHYST